MIKDKAKTLLLRHGPTVALAVILAASLAIASSAISRKNAELATLKAELGQAAEKILAISNDLGAAKTDAELALKNAAELKTKAEEHANELASFAKQAASCEALKKQLKPRK